MKIIIEPYNPNWKDQFQLEKDSLSTVLSEEVVIEHVGSTAIPKLAAKPVIDIMIGLDDFDTAKNHINSIVSLGYDYISEYEKELPFRKYFKKEYEGKHTHHIHMVQKDSDWWVRHLAFRNYLRNNVDDREKYEELKKGLAKKDWEDGNEYASAKTDFIRSIEKKILIK